jgi:hypothetical protein
LTVHQAWAAKGEKKKVQSIRSAATRVDNFEAAVVVPAAGNEVPTGWFLQDIRD